MSNGKVIKRFDISLRYHKGFKRYITGDTKKSLAVVDELVLHGTGGGKTANGILKWMEGGERSNQYRKGIALFHFLIGRLGEVYQIAPIDKWYYHSTSGKHDKKTIGIELVNPMPENKGDFQERQYVALEDLLFNKLFKILPNVRRIVSHDYNGNTYSGVRKSCPGPGFSWTMVRDMFKHRHIDLVPELFEDVIEFEPIMLKGALK